MTEYINENGKKCYKDVTLETPFSPSLMHEVDNQMEYERQWAVHTNLGSITVLDRLTGFGWRDTETGFRAKDKGGSFWLASGHIDVRDSGAKTFGEAIEFIKANANTCIGSNSVRDKMTQVQIMNRIQDQINNVDERIEKAHQYSTVEYDSSSLPNPYLVDAIKMFNERQKITSEVIVEVLSAKKRQLKMWTYM